ncbi:uncharacterized protein LOC133339342 isoform X2 [Lethenteron reissneri]|uniref:uncharacterized protein LOC133339342 isoform X2 n=1 Tax=Lethenteron reissneri TaxID=7753 RepID=UPI002AB5E970|nr:uncharacterized protein LOC133339342 isoform X2 [Lethenteron reissneri]
MAGWMEEEVLRALPAALDDDALAALITIPREDRSLLQRTLQQMADIYGLPSNTRHWFAARRKVHRRSLNPTFASTQAGGWRADDHSCQQDFRQWGRASLWPDAALITCYNCGLRGHVSSGWRAPRRRISGPRSSASRSLGSAAASGSERKGAVARQREGY